MSMIHLLHDNARERKDEDLLKMGAWVDVISGSARGNDGPFTIGVYRGWGFGKTTLLRLSKEKVEDDSKNDAVPVVTVWFNAWQYEREEHPLFPLIAVITDAIEVKVRDEPKLTKLKAIGDCLKALVVGVKIKGKFGVPGVAGIEFEYDPKKTFDPKALLKDKKDPLAGELLYHKAFEAFNKVTGEGGEAKIVVFIDDLDRCNPLEAVRLLECIKLVLSQRGFVFVLGVDNQVIETYLDKVYEEKYGFKEGTGRGRKYMEKIVQLPLQVPSHEKRFEKYVALLIGELGAKYDEDDVKIAALRNVQHVLAAHVDHNPRQLVRLIDGFVIDSFLWEGTRDLRDQFREFDEEVANALAIHRVVESALEPDLALGLVRDKDLRRRIVNGEPLQEPREGEAETAISTPARRKTDSDRLIERLTALPDLLDLLRSEAGRALVEPRHDDLWEAVQDFAFTTGTGRSVEFAGVVGERVREMLGLAEGDPIPASRLSEISTVDLTGTHVTDEGIKSLEKLTSLTELNLSGTQVTDEGIKSLEKLTCLTDLYLSYTQLTNEGLKSLEKLTSLTQLYMYNTRVTDEGLKSLEKLTSLTALNLSGTHVTDEGIKSLEKLTSLTALYLGGTQVTDERKEELRRALADCTIY